MNGVIFYATKHNSTQGYARWIAEATGLAAHDIKKRCVTLDGCDFIVLGCPVIYHKLLGAKWMRQHLDTISRKPVILFTVSGAPAGKKLDGWIANSLPQDLIDRTHRFALLGRQDPKELTLLDRMMLIIGSLFNPDRKAGREELHGFDYIDKASVQPVVDLIERWRHSNATTETSQTAISASRCDVQEQVT